MRRRRTMSSVFLNIKDIFLKGGEEGFSVRKYLRKPLYTYEFKKVAELMREMRKAAISIVIVLDEYGSTVGLITLEDMLEEIVGDIRDEYDGDEEKSIQRIAPREYMVDGSVKLDDLDERLNLELQSDEYDSIGGLVIGLLNHLPQEKKKRLWWKTSASSLNVWIRTGSIRFICTC